MKNTRPIYWHQGLFLQPQHFQLADIYHQSLLDPVSRLATPYSWGVSRLKIDETALANGTLAVEELEMLFPDGAFLQYPGNGSLQARSIEDDLFQSGKVRVLLGLKKWDTAGDNVTVVSDAEEAANVATRFVSTADPEEAPDLYTEGPAGQVKRLNLVPKLFWDSERDELGKYHLVPLVDLVMEDDAIKVSAEFAPPATRIDATEALFGVIKDVRDKVAARCRRLEEYKNPRGFQSSSLEPGVLFLFMGLRTLSRYVLWLTHLVSTGEVHPWRLYEAYCQLAGELTIFSQYVNTSGEGRNGANMVPRYNHEDLYMCFSAMRDLISQLLDEITFGPESIIRLEPEGEYKVGKMDQSVFSDRNVYYLAMMTEGDHEHMKEAMNTVAKLSTRENLPIIISRALPGLHLEHVAVPPPGLPQISSTTYFRVDTSGTQWDDVQRTNNIALFWDNAPEDMVAEIIVLRRT